MKSDKINRFVFFFIQDYVDNFIGVDAELISACQAKNNLCFFALFKTDTVNQFNMKPALGGQNSCAVIDSTGNIVLPLIDTGINNRLRLDIQLLANRQLARAAYLNPAHRLGKCMKQKRIRLYREAKRNVAECGFYRIGLACELICIKDKARCAEFLSRIQKYFVLHIIRPGAFR